MKRRRFIQGMSLAVPGALMATRPALSFAALARERVLSFHHLHTDEKLEIKYYANERMLPKALPVINRFLRDFRTGDAHPIDAKLLDILYWIQHASGSEGVYQVISAYRSPRTNDLLRQKSTGVAKHSLHMQGKAIDIRLTDLDTSLLQQAAIKLQAGGVGYYPGSNFVHLDTGRFRTW